MKVAVMGYGTVGSGVVEVIEHHSDIIPKEQAAKRLKFHTFLTCVIFLTMRTRICLQKISMIF